MLARKIMKALIKTMKQGFPFGIIPSRVGAALSGFRRQQDGNAVVEFALVSPLLLMLLLGIFEFSWLFFQRHTMLSAAERGARGVATQTLTSAEAITETQSGLAGWSATYTVTIDEPDPSNINDRDVVVRVSAPMQEINITGFFSGVLPSSLSVETFMRQEG